MPGTRLARETWPSRSLEVLEDRVLLAAADLTLIAGGLDAVLTRFDAEVRGAEVLGAKIPIVGDHLGATTAAGYVADIRSRIADVLDASANFDEVGEIEAGLTAALNALAPLGGFSIIPHGDTADPLITFEVTIEHSFADVPVTFDTGLSAPFLKVTADGEITVDLTLTANFTFGVENVNNTSSFFFDTSATDEFVIALGVDVAALNAEADLGLLKLKVTDRGGTTLGASTFTVDVKDADNKLLLSEIGAVEIDTTFDANANLQLRLETDTTKISSFLPVLQADLDIAWSFSAEATDEAAVDFGEDDPVVSLTVRMDASSFFEKYVNPLLEPISRIIEPVRPVVELLTKAIPGFNDIGILRDFVDGNLGNGDGKANLLDFVKLVDPSAQTLKLPTI